MERRFEQRVPISSYLFAVIAGNLRRESLSPRIGVITEPEMMPACLRELEDSEQYLQALEAANFEYEWGQYNVVVLPPAFPYGGMENPVITFASPSIITGTKAAVNVVIHEMAHSWTGNLVSCRDWGCIWLN